MNLKKILDRVNKRDSVITLNLAFRNFPEDKETELTSELQTILDGYIQQEYSTVELGKSPISIAEGLDWNPEEKVTFYTYTSDGSLDIRLGDIQEWLDDITMRIGDFCYIGKLTPVLSLYTYLTFENEEGEKEFYESYYEV